MAQLYAQLTHDQASNAWPNFLNAVQALPNGVTGDDPFDGFPRPQIAGMTPLTIESAGRIFSAILSDLHAGRSADAIVARVHAALTGTANRLAAMPSACSADRSHRLSQPGKARS